MSQKSNSSNNGSDSNLPDNTRHAFLFHDRGRKLFGGTSGEQDLGDSSVVQQNQEFSFKDDEEFPPLPIRSEASPAIGNRNAVQGLAVPQNLGNATSGSNLATNCGPGNLSVKGKNQLSSCALQKGSSSGGPSSQSHVPTVNSPNSKGWFYDVSSNTIFPGCLDDYFPSADPPEPVRRLQEQQDPLQRESSSSHQQGQQQVLAVSTGGTSSSVNNQDLVQNTKGAGGSTPGVLQASASSGYRNAGFQGLGVSQNFENAGRQITHSVTGGNISRSISSDVREQNQLASGVLQQGSSARGPISQSQVQAVNSPNPNDSFLPNLGDDVTSASSPEGVRRHQEQPDSLQKGLEETSDVQQNQEFNMEDENLPGFTGNADKTTNLRGKEKVQENTMPTMPPQHTPMSRTVGFSSGESSSSHQQGQQQFPAVSTGGTSSSMNSQDLLQNTNRAGGSIPGIFPASAASGNRSVIQGLEDTVPQAEGNISRSISSGGESSVQEHNQLMIGVLRQGSSAREPIPQRQGPNDANSNDSFLPNLPDASQKGGLEATSNVQQNQELNIQDGNLPGFTGNSENNTNLRGKERVQENTMPTMPPQHTTMSRTVGFSSGESCSSHRPQTNAVSAVGSNVAQLLNRFVDYAVRGLQEQNREFRVEKLFETIYCSQYEKSRVYAEDELYNRGWVYHKGLESWLLKDPDVPLSEKTQTFEKGSYIYFDLVSKRLIKKDDFVVEYKMLKERPALP